MALNLASILENGARNSPEKTAIIFDDLHLTYHEVQAMAKQFAGVLADLGVQRGDMVGLHMPNVHYFTICYFGILYTGAVVVPFNVLYVGDEIKYQLEDSDAVALITWEGFAPQAMDGFNRVEDCHNLICVTARPGGEVPAGTIDYHEKMRTASPDFDMAQTGSDDTAVIFYTSGTTGHPKGAELSHFNVYYNAQYASEKLFLDPENPHVLGQGDVALVALPLFHCFGQVVVQNATFFGGGAITMLPRFTPEDALRIIERDKVTIFSGVPTMYFALLHCPEADQYDTASLQWCCSGGAAMPVEVMTAFKDKYGIQILEGYGLSETSPVASFNSLDRPCKPGSIGHPIFGVDIKIFDDYDHEVPAGDVGEIVIRGHNVMKGYLNRPEATREVMRNDWFHTGDLGRFDDEGYLFIVDRKKEMIIRGGFNVYPREIEEVLYAHPAIQEAAVIGMPDEQYGEEIKAIVALKNGHTLSAEDLMAYCREHMAANKYPRCVEFRESLPKGPTGKILKKALKA